jgi:hypothetical protein
MKAHRRVDVYIYIFSISALVGGEWSASRRVVRKSPDVSEEPIAFIFRVENSAGFLFGLLLDSESGVDVFPRRVTFFELHGVRTARL